MIACSRCHKSKPPEDFTLDGRTRKTRCKACVCEIFKERYSDNRMIANERKANQAFSSLMIGWPAPR